MALPKYAFRAAIAAAGALAGAGAFIGGRAIAKNKSLPHIPRLPKRSGSNPVVRDGFTLEGEPIRLLEVGKVYQSVAYTDPEKKFDLALEYYRCFDNLFEFGPQIDSILALGAGGCSFPKHAAYYHHDVRVDAVEADHDIVRLAHEKFYIDELPKECQFRLYESDALDYLLQCQEQGTLYSAVVNDCFEGKHADTGLLTEESLNLTKACMQPGGLYLMNAVSERNGRNLKNVRRATAALKKVFKHVYVFPCTDAEMGGEDNYVLFATDGTYKIER